MQSKRIASKIISSKRPTPKCFEDLRILALTFADQLPQKILQSITGFDFTSTELLAAVEENQHIKRVFT
jgi:hypothetical protein